MRNSDSQRRRVLVHTFVVVAVACLGCVAEKSPPHSATLKLVRTISGDTTIVRNDVRDPSDGLRSLIPVMTIGKTAGPDEYMFGAIQFLLTAPDGNIWIYDSQLKALRVYSDVGAFVRQVGREGNGPGEYSSVKGMTLLGKDRIILCITRGPTVILFGRDGRHSGDWKLQDHGVSSTCDTLVSDSAGTGYVLTNLPLKSAPKSEQRTSGTETVESAGAIPEEGPRAAGFVSISPSGAVLDSMMIPFFGFAAPKLIATSGEGGVRQTANSYSPRETWGFSRNGHLIWARTDRYAIHLLHRDGKVTRVERSIDPVPYDPAEIEETVAATTAHLRCADPAWKHPEFPVNKVFFRGVTTGSDGRLWVHVSTPSEVMPDSAVDRSPLPVSCPTTRSLRRFHEATVWDVFESTGEFLGRVKLPGRTTVLSLDRDFVWLRTLDENDVQSATKYRIEPPFGR